VNKKEQERFEELLTRAALRSTSPTLPDVDVPNDGLSTGFLYAGENSVDPRVDVACSSSVHHAFGRNDKTTSQRPRRLYSTRLLALKGLRYAVEQRCAAILRGIDRQIEEEEVKNGTNGR